MQTEDIEAQEVSKDYGKATKIIILSEQVLQTLDLWQTIFQQKIISLPLCSDSSTNQLK